jgi:hypothetical protein
VSRVTRKELDSKVENINRLLGSRFRIQQSYGGYRLQEVDPKDGGVSDVSPRLSTGFLGLERGLWTKFMGTK